MYGHMFFFDVFSPIFLKTMEKEKRIKRGIGENDEFGKGKTCQYEMFFTCFSIIICLVFVQA